MEKILATLLILNIIFTARLISRYFFWRNLSSKLQTKLHQSSMIICEQNHALERVYEYLRPQGSDLQVH